MSSLVCLGRPTVTGLLSTCGLQFRDWTAAYRLFSQSRIDMSRIFAVVCREAVRELPRNGRLCLAMDDSLLRKCGTRTYGVGWRRDPLARIIHEGEKQKAPFCV